MNGRCQNQAIDIRWFAHWTVCFWGNLRKRHLSSRNPYGSIPLLFSPVDTRLRVDLGIYAIPASTFVGDDFKKILAPVIQDLVYEEKP